MSARFVGRRAVSALGEKPRNTSELEAAQDLTEGTSGLLLGDRNFWSPRLKEVLAQQGLALQAPFRQRKHDPWPQRSYLLSRWRYRIDTIFSQLVERTGLKRIWARDSWHLWNRLLRKVLMHTLAVWTTTSLGAEPFSSLASWLKQLAHRVTFIKAESWAGAGAVSVSWGCQGHG